jgi:site-specific recombinase XerD
MDTKQDRHGDAWPALDEDIPEIKGFGVRMRSELGRSVATVKEYGADVHAFASFLGSRAKLIAADQGDVRNFVVELISKRCSKAVTVRRKLASLRSFYSYLILEKIRVDNPALGVPSPKAEKRLPRILNESEVSRVIDARKAGRHEEFTLRNYAMLELLYASGIRRAELVGINVEHVDLDAKLAHVIGKGNKERLVMLNASAVKAIKAYLRVRPRSSDPALFLSQRKKRLGFTQTWTIFSEHLALSGVKKKASLHTMRHSFATHLLENDVDLVSIKEMLGHESLATTQVYTNVSMRHMRNSYDKGHPRDKQAY